MTTTTDTGPDVQVQNATTGEVYPSQVLNEAARLGGAASDGWTPGDPWVPGPNNIPAVTALLKPLSREQLDAETAPVRERTELKMPLRLDRPAARDDYGIARAEYDVVCQIAQDWRDLEFLAASKQHIPAPQVSDDYRVNRDVPERLYERQRDALVRGLPTAAPLPEQHPARELTPDRLDKDAALRRKKLAQAAQGERRELPPATVDDTEPDGWVEATRLRRVLAWIGSRRRRGA